MVFHKSQSDSKSPEASRTLFSILADFNNFIDWMIMIRLPIFNSSNHLSNPSRSTLGVPITIGLSLLSSLFKVK